SYSFAMICFLVLMQNGEGITDKAPNYIIEKMYLLRSGIEAFDALDIHNKRIVISWCEKWKIEVPEKVLKNFKGENNAFKGLQEMGFNL
ncbi:hypothetical protein LCGC14_3125900, partial [marine sediment metagenome]